MHAFLPPVLNRENLIVMTQACGQKHIIEGGRVTGAEYLQRSTKGRVDASSEVILSVGAIQSPQLLQFSGGELGELLSQHGIPVVVDRPAMGGNLQDYYQMRIIVKIRENKSLNIDVRNPLSLMQMGLDWVLRGRDALTVGVEQVRGAARTKHVPSDHPTVSRQARRALASLSWLHGGRLVVVLGVAMKCRYCFGLPKRRPEISSNYLSMPLDHMTLVNGVKILSETYNQSAFEKLWRDEVVPGSGFSSDADIPASVRRMGGTVALTHAG